jgi:PAS domain S-box-containing protein
MKNQIKNKKNSISVYAWLVPIALAAVLVVVSQNNFLLFHTLAELFSVIVAVLIFVVAWQMYPFTRNNFLMYLGCGYFWVGVLDIFHTLAYKGMGVYGVTDGNMGIQFWIVTRYIEAFLLLTAPWFLTHKLQYRSPFIIYGILAGGAYIAVTNEFFPVMFVEGVGLSDLKVIAEYIIILMLGLAIVAVWKQRAYLDSHILRLMIISIVLTMCAELAFTFYVSVYGLSNIVGHVFKFASFWLIFMAMVRTTLQDPFNAMARDSSTYDAMPDAVIVVDSEGVIHQANLAAFELAGVKKEKLIGESSHELFHLKSVDESECLVCINSREGNKINAYEVEDKINGRWLDFTLSPIESVSEYKGMVEVIRDITSRKLIEQKLEDVNELKNSIVENLPAMLFVKKAEDHRYVEWNKAAEEITGLKREEMLGKNDFDFFTHEEAEFYISMDKKVINEGELYDIPEETIHTKYKGVRLLHTRKIPIFNQQGQASYLLGISQDITDNKETEEVLRRSQRMEVVGQLSGGIAHDFNNQLGIVTGYLEFLKEYLKNEEKQTAWVNSASKAARRCVELTRQLLLFSRTKSPEKATVDINGVINNIEDMIQKSVTPEVNVQFQLEEELWPVVLDEGEFGDAIINMIINSRDAMPSGGDVTVRTSNVYLDDEVMIADQGARPGEYVMLEVQDNGIGMSDEVVEHIFEPFFTTKPVGSGTGLGMSMVYSFVQRYDGTIKIESSTGYGTSIRIYLPRSVTDSKFSRSDIAPDHMMVLPRGTERVLVVDDEIELLNLTGEYISSLGYEVFKAVNAMDALEILGNESVDLVFSDIVMPGGINGYELALDIKDKYPDVKVLLSSGYIGRSPKTEYKGVVVNKPYTRQEIANQIRSIFDN